MWFMFIYAQQNESCWSLLHNDEMVLHKGFHAHTFCSNSVYLVRTGKTRKLHCNVAPESEVKHKEEGQ